MHSTVEARAKLEAFLEGPGAGLDARVAAGDELAALGDERATAIDRVVARAGAFLFGGSDASSGDEGEARAPAVLVAPRTVHVSAFRIDRYPVTVAAYAAFVDAGGYRERRHWSRPGWAWRAREGIDRPRFWGEAEWAPYLVANHPVVGVSVYEAEAYASFRDARLPTEAEWEKACRGTDGRCHPWGDAWRDDASGSRHVGPRGTVPVGTYRLGPPPLRGSHLVGSGRPWCVGRLHAHPD